MAAKPQEDREQGCFLLACLKFSGDPCKPRKRRPGEDGSRRDLAPQAGDMKTGHGNEKKRRNWYELFQVTTSGRKTVPVESELLEEMDGNDLAEEGKLKKATNCPTIRKIIGKIECCKVAYLDRRVKAVPVPGARVSEVDQGIKEIFRARGGRNTWPEEIREVIEISEQQAATTKDNPKSISTRSSPESNNTYRKSGSMPQNPIKGSRSIMGMSVVLIALATQLLFGRPSSVICISAWFYVVPRLARLTEPICGSQGRSRPGGHLAT